MQPLTISAVHITDFSLPFARPYQCAGQTLTERVGYYIELTAADGRTARGEIAPLPGLSTESLKKAKHDVEEAVPALTGFDVPLDRDALVARLRAAPWLNAVCPSVRCGIESALFLLACGAAGVELGVFLGAVRKNTARAVLLQGACAQVVDEARRQSVAGARVFKLKVGDRNVALDVKKMRELRAVIGSEGCVRLDANGAWQFNEAVLFAQLAGIEQIEFIEEPVNDMARANEFYTATGLPVALDETLRVMRCGVSAPGRCSPPMAAGDAVHAYVIKPMMLGGIVAALDWIAEARRLGKKAVISSSFETPVGAAVLSALADCTDAPAGLDTGKWFKDA